MASPSASPGSPTRITLLAAFLFSVFWAMLCNLLVELIRVLDTPAALRETLSSYGLIFFLLGSVVVWCALVLLVGLTGRLWLGAGLLLLVTTIVGLANRLKLEQRDEPLYPSDLQFATQWRFLLDMVGLTTILGASAVMLGLALAVTWTGSQLTARRYPRIGRASQPGLWKRIVALRILAVALSTTALVQAAQFNEPSNPVRATYEAAGVKWAWWYQKLNYERNGLVAGLLYNTDVPAMTRPDGYSSARMAEIVNRYSAMARTTNQDRDAAGIEDVNIVLVLSEAFSDPTRVPGVTFDEDPIPFTRDMMTRTRSGNMLAQLVGGGTANMEFEILTGMSLALFEPQMSSPFQMLLPKHDSFPSSLRFLATKGHRAVAIHPYVTTMYQREVAYPALGFQDFVGASRMRHTGRLEKGEFISDASAFEEVRQVVRESDDPVVVNLVTMQNHFPTDHVYADPIPAHGLPEDRTDLAEGYARGLSYTDQALAEFLEALEDDDEKTAVVFYGDHLPGFWPDDLIAENGVLMRQTPFFLWSNFTELPHREEPTTSPTQFLPMLFEALDAPVPPYYALLDELRSEVPAMEQGILLDAEGRRTTESMLTADARRVLEDYRLVQYDLSIGERHSLDEMFPQSLDRTSDDVAAQH